MRSRGLGRAPLLVLGNLGGGAALPLRFGRGRGLAPPYLLLGLFLGGAELPLCEGGLSLGGEAATLVLSRRELAPSLLLGRFLLGGAELPL